MAKRLNARKTASANGAAEPRSSDQPVITIHAGDKRTEAFKKTVTRDAPLARLAQEWSYILRVRSRWVGDAGQRETFGLRALDDLKNLGIGPDDVQQFAKADRIEIELHDWRNEDTQAASIHEAAAEVPWEYLISAATRAQGRFQSLLISRLFRNGTPQVTPSPPQSMLFLESAPGRIGDQYEFDDEEERIRAAVGATGRHEKKVFVLNTPQVSELRERLQKEKWEAIHVTGIDTHQAAFIIENFYDVFPKDSEIWKEITKSSRVLCDGMILREGNESECPVRYDKLAGILVGRTPPRIVTLNLYHSGARTARELVRRGAHVALGFLDEIDDELAERFFQAFYWAWCHPADKALSIPDAFLDAWDKMSASNLYGTSIVIWMGRSVFDSSGRRAGDRRSSIAKKRRGRR